MNTQPQKRPSLSQAPGKRKIAVAVPGAIFFGVAWGLGFFKAVTQFVTLALVAYALVGIVEVLAGDSLVRVAKRWDQLASWKQLLVSLVVVVGSLALFMALMPLVANVVYK